VQAEAIDDLSCSLIGGKALNTAGRCFVDLGGTGERRVLLDDSGTRRARITKSGAGTLTGTKHTRSVPQFAYCMSYSQAGWWDLALLLDGINSCSNTHACLFTWSGSGLPVSKVPRRLYTCFLQAITVQDPASAAQQCM
jgi:hypothetical protein